MTRPVAGLKEGNWCEEWMGIVAAVQGTFMDMDILGVLMERLWVLIAV